MKPPSVVLIPTALVVLLTVGARAQAPSIDPAIFVPVQEVGNPQGALADMHGCSDNGATVTSLTIWSTADFIRGMQVFLSDGRNNLFGCVNTTLPSGPFIGCMDQDIEQAIFTFAPGETITAMSTWPGQYLGDAAATDAERMRAGALAFNTSMGRFFDFGMRIARPAATIINIGSGILCGISQHVGADINSLGFVFLQPVTASVLGDLTYQGVPAAQVDENGLQVGLSDITVANSTLDNEAAAADHTYTYNATLQQEQYTNWSKSAVGLDSYLMSTVNGGTPVLTASDDGRDLQGWTVAPTAAQDRLTQGNNSVPWGYNVSVPGGGIDSVMVSYSQAVLTALPYSGSITVQLATGGSFAFPIQGTYEGYTYSPIVTDTQVIKAPPPPPPVIVPATTQSNGVDSNLQTSTSPVSQGTSSGSSGSSSNKLAIILGVLLGVLACLVVVAIIIGLLVMRRRRRDSSDADSESQRSSSQAPAALGYVLPWGARRGGGGSRASSHRGERGERATQPSNFGLPDPKLGEDDVAGAQPLPGPSPRPSQELPLPNPKEEALTRSSPATPPAAAATAAAGAATGAATGAAAGAASHEDAPRDQGVDREMPYSRYRSLRLDNIRSALGLGRRPSEATAAPPAPPTSIELPQKENNPPSANPPSPLAGPKSGSATPGKGGAKGETDPQRFPPHSPISGIQWGFPVAPHQDPTSDNPQKSAFHQSCDPVLQSQQAMQDKYENLMSDTASTTTGVVTTAAPSEAGESAVDDSRPPTRGSEAPTVGSEVPTVGAEDSTGATAPPPAPPSEAPSGLSRLSRTASGEEEHFVEPKYLRPGDEDGDALLVEPTHGRIEGYESKPAASPSAEGSRKVVEHEGDSITLGKRPKSAQAAEPSGKRIMVEDTPVALGGKYRTPEGASGRPAKNLLRFEDAQLKLGKGYQTRGRNE